MGCDALLRCRCALPQCGALRALGRHMQQRIMHQRCAGALAQASNSSSLIVGLSPGALVMNLVRMPCSGCRQLSRELPASRPFLTAGSGEHCVCELHRGTFGKLLETRPGPRVCADRPSVSSVMLFTCDCDSRPPTGLQDVSGGRNRARRRGRRSVCPRSRTPGVLQGWWPPSGSTCRLSALLAPEPQRQAQLSRRLASRFILEA